nr:spore cortex biosynthesis protein YabQ [Lachnospiraceae bacterium]
MSADVVNESILWVSCFFVGILITAVYDALRVVRRVVRHKYFFVALEDILFWVFVSVALFLLLYHMNHGSLRWFAVFGLFIGMFFYKKIIGDKLVIFMSTILGRILYVVVGFIKPPLMLVKSAFSRGARVVKTGFFQIKKKLTGDIKGFKIILCKHKNEKQRDTHESEHSS